VKPSGENLWVCFFSFRPVSRSGQFTTESTMMIKGLIAPLLTPFDDNLNLDQSLYNDLAKHRALIQQ
jgi:hypothetical protein